MTNVHTASNGEKSTTGQKIKQETIEKIRKLGLTPKEDSEHPRRNTIITQTKSGKDIAILVHESVAVDRGAIMRDYANTLKKQYRGIKVVLATNNNTDEENKKIAAASKRIIDEVINLNALSDFLEKN